MGSCAFSKLEFQDYSYVESNNIGIILPDETSANKYTLNHAFDRNLPYNGQNQIIQYMPESEVAMQLIKSKKLNSIFDQIVPTVRSIITKEKCDNPYDLLKLQQVAKEENLWMPIIYRLINQTVIEDPLGASVIAIFLDETVLPSIDQIKALTDNMLLDCKVYSYKMQRNILIVLSCLSEKVAGTLVAKCLGERTYMFLKNCLKYGKTVEESGASVNSDQLQVILHALICLEKYSLSSHNRLKIAHLLDDNSTGENPLLLLNKWKKSENFLMHQIGFLANSLLENFYPPSNYIYDYLRLSTENVNAILHDRNISESLKLSPDGMEARNDTLTFESVRATCCANYGLWYYEATILTHGLMQIGFASTKSKFSNYQGFGIGDDDYSVGYDGYRNLIWHNKLKTRVTHMPPWKPGDTVGFLLDIWSHKIHFYCNGIKLKHVHSEIFRIVKNGFYPAASLLSFQHIVFNFGRSQFKYAPNCGFQNFNEACELAESERFILPKRIKLEMLRVKAVGDDECTLCCSNKFNAILLPCKHGNFCDKCTKRLKGQCPICRKKFTKIEIVRLIR